MKNATPAQKRIGLRIHAIVFASSMVLMSIINLLTARRTGRPGTLAWGTGILSHWLAERSHLARNVGTGRSGRYTIVPSRDAPCGWLRRRCSRLDLAIHAFGYCLGPSSLRIDQASSQLSTSHNVVAKPAVQRTAACFPTAQTATRGAANPSTGSGASRSGQRLIHGNCCSCGAYADVKSRKKPLPFHHQSVGQIGRLSKREDGLGRDNFRDSSGDRGVPATRSIAYT